MYFIYLDESGSTGRDPLQRFFVLVALIARAENCLRAQEQLEDLKLRFFPNIQPEEIEFKGRNLLQRQGFFKNVRTEICQKILDELYNLMRTLPFWLFTTVLDKEHPTINRLRLSPDDVYHYAYKNLIYRVDKFLQTEKGPGLVFIDSRASSIRSHMKDARLIQIHREYLRELKKTESETHLVEYPVFVQSQFFAAIQLADLCAYELFHALQSNPEADTLDKLNPESSRGLKVIIKMLKHSEGWERFP
ncbi:MAG: DUF3800 domain-containing protein [Anaerolineae bacterium]